MNINANCAFSDQICCSTLSLLIAQRQPELYGHRHNAEDRQLTIGAEITHQEHSVAVSSEVETPHDLHCALCNHKIQSGDRAKFECCLYFFHSFGRQFQSDESPASEYPETQQEWPRPLAECKPYGECIGFEKCQPHRACKTHVRQTKHAR